MPGLAAPARVLVFVLIFTAPSFGQTIRCYDCHGEFCITALQNNPEQVSQCETTGKCFIRDDQNGYVYRGCTDETYYPGMDTSQNGCRTHPQYWAQAVWCLCDTELCNGLDTATTTPPTTLTPTTPSTVTASQPTPSTTQPPPSTTQPPPSTTQPPPATTQPTLSLQPTSPTTTQIPTQTVPVVVELTPPLPTTPQEPSGGVTQTVGAGDGTPVEPSGPIDGTPVEPTGPIDATPVEPTGPISGTSGEPPSTTPPTILIIQGTSRSGSGAVPSGTVQSGMAPSSGTGVTGSGSSTRTSGMIPNGAGVSQGTGVGANTSGMRATSGSMATPAIANPPTAMGQTVPGSNTQTQPPAGNNDMMTLLQMLGNGLTSNPPGPSIGSGGGTPASVSPPPTPAGPTAATPSTQDPFLSSLLAALTTTPGAPTTQAPVTFIPGVQPPGPVTFIPSVQTPVTPAPTVPTVPTQPPAVVTTRGLNNNVIPTTPPRHCGFNNGGCTQICNMMSQTVVCSCHTGYRLLMDGRSCVAIRCTDPGTPQHGQRSVNGLEVGGEIQFECLAGYRLTGNNVVRCTADGTWNSENPTCEAIRCTDPGTPQHGRRSVSGLEVDGEVQFECLAGYRLTGNNVVRCTTDGTWSSENPTCEDINECTSGTARCNPETSTCVNTVGSYNCVCMPGYEQDGVGGCRDIDECQRGLDRCDPLTQDCVNTPGSYQCRCKDGYKLTADKESCEKLEDKIVVRQDINECDGNDHGCDMENGGCQDTLTSYYCYCNSGYERSDTNLGTTVCVDIDECQTRTDSCDRLYGSCRNTPGSYTCSCNTGFELAANNRNCRDINECERGLDTCDPLVESCENTMGSYRCVCMEGYKKNSNGICEDIDECRENIAKCELLKQDCENTRGSYRCVCRQGQKLSKDGKFCEDEALQCPQPRILNGAYFYVAGANKDVYTAGDRVSYTCDDGYEINGASLSTCLDTGEWDPVVPKCLGVLCPEPQIVDFSTRRDSRTTFHYQDTASFQCFAGYVMDGPERITCRANGAWTTYPTCSACPKDSYADNNECKRCPANSHTMSDASRGITSCICDRGYTGPPGGPCQDENECSAVASVCGRQKCRNTVGSYNCFCDPGYSMDNDRQTCQDLDECQLGTHTCDQICNNTPGGYTCSCQDGYSLVNNKCEDINECDQSGTCDPRATCQNLLGSYKCTCMKGFVASGSACVDDNECSDAITPPLCDQVCTNTVGSYMCSCNPGFALWTDGRCHDIDECEDGSHSCEQGCTNTVGSYKCTCNSGFALRDDKLTCRDFDECGDSNDCAQVCENVRGSFKCSCFEGYMLARDNKTCQDVDECQGDVCPLHSTCENTEGSFNCRCDRGYQKQDDGQCVDVDECADGPCAPVIGTCKNTAGSYMCGCVTGYTLLANKVSCEDIDECAEQIDSCGPHATCMNTPGSYTCTCKKGFQATGPNSPCNNVNECERTDICDQICTDTFGSYQCSCRPGFILDGEDGRCRDIDECLEMKPCSHSCMNTPGGYECQCPTGLTLQDDNHTCRDINECTQPGHGCQQTCVNTQGTYNCACRTGYTLNPDFRMCDDINECSVDNGGCPQICENNAGSYDCKCQDGFVKQGTDCIDVNECNQNNGKCTHLCQNTAGSYQCACRPGYELNPDKHSCDDVNECATGVHSCQAGFNCSNLVGSYVCQFQCPSSFVIREKSCYYFFAPASAQQAVNFTVALSKCQELSPLAHRAIIDSPEESALVHSLRDIRTPFLGQWQGLWLDARSDSSGTFTWETTRATVGVNDTGTEIINSVTPPTDKTTLCLWALTFLDELLLQEYSCETKSGYLCEIDKPEDYTPTI